MVSQKHGISALGLERAASSRRYADELSSGERQRVALAFAARPSLLLCDEVTSALDVVERQFDRLYARHQARLRSGVRGLICADARITASKGVYRPASAMRVFDRVMPGEQGRRIVVSPLVDTTIRSSSRAITGRE